LDLAYPRSESDFLLEPRRLTVAVSRPKRKLIVLAAQTLFTLMPADLDDYEQGALWKHLRHACGSPPLWIGEYGGYRRRVLTVQAACKLLSSGSCKYAMGLSITIVVMCHANLAKASACHG
jgi:hypothetical protein